MTAKFFFPNAQVPGDWDIGGAGILVPRDIYASGYFHSSTAPAVIAGANAQGEGQLAFAYNVIATAAANPSGVTLPVAVAGRRVTIVNRGANPLKVYPAVGAAIDGLGANVAIDLPVNGLLVFEASSTTQWYSSLHSVGSGKGPAFSAWASATTALPNNTSTKVLLATEEYDTNNYFDSVTNSRFQPLVPGYFRVAGQWTTTAVAANSTSVMRASFLKNGVTSLAFRDKLSSANIGIYNDAEVEVFLNGSTDYVEFFAFQNTGVAMTLGSGQLACRFWGHMVREA